MLYSLKFWAFFSYSNVDLETVIQIHQQLESYKIPRYDRKKASNIPKSFTPVFLNQKDLGLGNIDANIENALENCNIVKKLNQIS